ncbi:hypothetical protein ACWCQL_36900 [Streptomyces sp. NPDC002073]|uniref:hypothetical protein n=1 Tax=Streptomyces sp. NBC_00239 TaxID=2903640 RepID=UPI002E2DEB28|nr:hypothetical protein [Streptomyces sp. NBC_00239]
MTASNHRETEIRRLLEGPRPPVPSGLAALAAGRGLRLLRRRRALHRAGWLLLIAAVAAFTVWASITHPWVVPPSTTAPTFEAP